MAIQVKRGGVWTTPASGSISIKSDGVWKSANSLSVKNASSVWANSQYVAYPSAPTNFRATYIGNGDNRQVTFAWDPGAGGAPVTNYVINVYNSSDVYQYGIGVGTSTSYTVTFNNASTTYYVRIFAGGTAGYTLGSPRLQVVIGNTNYYSDNYVWSNEVYGLTPSYLSQSSGQDGPSAFDGNLGTVARGQWWAWNSPDDNGYAEGMAFAVYASHQGSPRKMLLIHLASAPDGNPPGQIWWDLLTYPTWTNLGYTAGYGTTYGNQYVTGSRVMNAGATEYFRVHYNSLGYNPSEYGFYQWRTREIGIGYRIEINSPIYNPPTNSAVYNA